MNTAQAFSDSDNLICEPVIILPTQLAESNAARHAPEMRLVAAILEDALSCITRNIDARRGRRRREFVEAWNWIWSNSRDWPFSFVNVCDLLGLDASAVRTHMQRVVDGVPVAPRSRFGCAA